MVVAKHATLRKKNKDCLAQIQDNVSEWGDMSICEQLFQWTPIEHTIYRTRGELANHYTKDAVDLKGEGTQSNTAFFSRNGMGWS
jgi:hypothetical protein